MPRFEELQIKEAAFEAAAADVGAMPEERGASKPNLPQRRYTFQLPVDLGNRFDIVSTDKLGDRIKLDFGSDGLAAFLPGSNGSFEYAGQWFGRISAVPRNKAKTGEAKRLVSDLTYLAVALGHPSKAVTIKSTGETEFVSADTQGALAALLAKHAGEYFQADNEWSAFCNVDKVRYISDGTGGNVEDPTGTKGCGKRYYSRDIPKDAAGQAQDRFPCTCGAALLAFQNLGRFGASAVQSQG